VSDLFESPDGATPLDPDERDGLLPTWIAFRHELNAAERDNIAKGLAWASRQKKRRLLDESFVRDLHRQMFGDVWRWAGQYRRTARNLGIDAARIPLEVANLLDDARHWVEFAVFPADEIAVRLHHRMVSVHPFPNGNGRHARLLADLLVERLGEPPFTWGRRGLLEPSETRAACIAALRAADDHDPRALVAFARS